MNYHPEYTQLVLQEVPNEISVIISLSGCGHVCRGCHSPQYQNRNGGVELTIAAYQTILDKYKGKASCVLFFGGDLKDKAEVYILLYIARQQGFKTALYTGYELDELPKILQCVLNYIKVGAYVEELGGLDKVGTNQRLLRCDKGTVEDITWMMQR